MASQSSPKRSTGSSPALRRCRVDRVLEAVHRHLAEHRRNRAVERAREQVEPLRRAGRPLEQALEHDVLAEDRGRLGERQRGGEVVDALRPGQRGVHAVPELVGHHEHVVRARGVVEHHVRVRRGHRVRAERAAALARARRAVDVAAGEELGGHLAQLGREGPVAVEHDLLGLAVGDAVVAVGHRRHAVVVGEPVEAEQARLQRRTSGARGRSGPAPPRSAPATDSSLASLARLREASQCG